MTASQVIFLQRRELTVTDDLSAMDEDVRCPSRTAQYEGAGRVSLGSGVLDPIEPEH